MAPSPIRRPRLFLASSYDARARKEVTVVELRGAVSRFWERIDDAPARQASRIAFALDIAHAEGLRDFDVFLSNRVGTLLPEIPPELGHVRIRWVRRAKNTIARQRAHQRLRELVPGRPRDDDDYSLAELGIDLEILAFEVE